MLQKHPEQKPNSAQVSSEKAEMAEFDVQHVCFDLSGNLLFADREGQLQEAALWQQNEGQKQALQKAFAGVAIVWVPSEQMNLLHGLVPGKRRADWMAALPYAFEESLSDPVETLHFAVLNRTVEGETDVAVISRDRMQLWVEQLQQSGLDHALLVPDCFRLPWTVPQTDTLSSESVAKAGVEAESQAKKTQQAWSVYRQSAQRWVVRTGPFSGFAATPQWFEQLKNLQVHQHQPVSVQFYESTQLLQSCDASRKGQDRKVCGQFNLRSGPFAPRQRQSGEWRRWRWPLVSVAALVVVYLLGLTLQAQHDRQQAEAYQMQTQALFKQRFPEVKRIVNLRAQAKSGFAGGNAAQVSAIGPAEMVHKIEGLFANYSQVKIKRLDWKATSQELSFQLEAPQVSQLQSLAQGVQKLYSRSELKVKNVSQTLAEGVLYVVAD
ncbi:type II secretion system protein GspL [Thiomicrorhabdus sp. zzn3]|uniref:type II secretion system protein GspL n=1 Tax=Thiomicrorhabdus sp. zzn3 TaxID=3039775 RepID=UPI00243709B2|nr:type II secretion system protein GspL [Thiomicrorhabdus sp. zzn3]MDG6777324.1 type II secretion system protein GspL [Thiomicrorhabdus sp. zzn3]